MFVIIVPQSFSSSRKFLQNVCGYVIRRFAGQLNLPTLLSTFSEKRKKIHSVDGDNIDTMSLWDF